MKYYGILTLVVYILLWSCDSRDSKGKISPDDSTKTDTTKTDTTGTDTTKVDTTKVDSSKFCPYPDTLNCQNPNFSNMPEHGKLLYVRLSGSSAGLYQANLDLSVLKHLIGPLDTIRDGITNKDTVVGDRQIWYPCFNSNGLKIVAEFGEHYSNMDKNIFLNIDGSNKVIHQGGAFPQWSPNDSKISSGLPALGSFTHVIFDSVNFSSSLVYNTYYQSYCHQTLEPNDPPMYWTLDGNYLIVGCGVKPSGKLDIFMVDYQNHTIVSRLTNNSILERNFVVSKDNKYVAIFEQGAIKVYTFCELSKSHPQGFKISSATIKENQVIRFSQDARFVVFDAKMEGDADFYIYLADLGNGGVAQKMIKGEQPDIFIEK